MTAETRIRPPRPSIGLEMAWAVRCALMRGSAPIAVRVRGEHGVAVYVGLPAQGSTIGSLCDGEHDSTSAVPVSWMRAVLPSVCRDQLALGILCRLYVGRGELRCVRDCCPPTRRQGARRWSGTVFSLIRVEWSNRGCGSPSVRGSELCQWFSIGTPAGCAPSRRRRGR
jgi:hypothetical protein